MEITSRIETKVVKRDVLSVYLSIRDRDAIVKALHILTKRAKLDRLEDYILKRLIQALESPEIPDEKLGEPVKPLPRAAEIELPAENLEIDKKKVVEEVKAKTDKENLDIKVWIKGSIEYAQRNMGIKTVPKSDSVEDFYDWLVEVGVIDKYGNPLPKR